MRTNAKYADTKLVLLLASAGPDGSVQALSVRLNARGIPHIVDDRPTALVSPAAVPAPPPPPRMDPGQVWLWVPEPAAASAQQVIGEWVADPSLEALERAPIPPEAKGPGCILHGGGKHFWKCPRCTGYVCDQCGGGVDLYEPNETICRACAYYAIRDGRRLNRRLKMLVAALAAGLLLAVVGGASPRILLDRAQRGFHHVLGR